MTSSAETFESTSDAHDVAIKLSSEAFSDTYFTVALKNSPKHSISAPNGAVIIVTSVCGGLSILVFFHVRFNTPESGPGYKQYASLNYHDEHWDLFDVDTCRGMKNSYLLFHLTKVHLMGFLSYHHL